MRHVPSADTRDLNADFEKDLAAALLPQEGYDVRKWLFVPPSYEEYRFILGTRGQKPLICVGVNPSTAAPDRLDRTLQSVERIAKHNGFDSFLMFNVSAQRATDPNLMDAELDEHLHQENMKAFDYLLSLSDQPVVWAAWGAVIEKRPYLSACVQDLFHIGQQHHAVWVCCGPLSKRGHPHHPLYLKSDSPLAPFEWKNT
ncbi:MAG: DUF1643 domain-containing protein [Clostridia bacterium]|nr:DUF1643 domain-containing protein [Clostridia bacterium]